MSTDKRKFINGISATDATDASKKLDIQVNPSQTANKTATLESNVTDNRTITLPDVTDTLVGKDQTVELKNKTIVVSSNTITTAASGNLTSTELNNALAELQGDIDTTNTNLSNHVNDIADAHPASAITNTPYGNLIATNVQGALNELQGDMDNVNTYIGNVNMDLSNHINDTTGAHAASAISNTPSGNLAATDVQNALNELQSDVDSRAPINNPSFTGTTFDAVSSTATNISTSNTISSVNIGTGSGANTITIGSANSTVNILGNVLHETATNVDIKDALLTLNKGGGAGSGSASGIEIEENSAITGYVETSGDRNSWVLKAPNTAGIVSITPGSTNDTVTLNAASQTLTNKTIGDALNLDGQASKPSNPSAGFFKIYVKDSDGKLAVLDSSGNETVMGGLSYAAVAGENLTANDAIYIASSSDTGRTLGRAYKLDATNANRIEFAGFATANATTGSSVNISVGGQLTGFSGLTVGQPVFASVTVPGGNQATVPSTVGQHIIQLGVADSATSLIINSALSATVTLVESPNQYIGAATGDSLVVGSYSLNSSAILQADSTTKGFLPPRMTQAQRDLISPLTTGLQIYNTSSNKLNVYNGTSWVDVGSGSGSSGKNYITNSDFEAGATTNWSLGNVSINSTTKFPDGSPTFGSGASANLSITTVTGGSQIAGTYSMSYVSSTSTTAGNFVASDAFTIDKEHQAKALKFSFSYQAAVNPSNANWSGTSANSFGVAIYDVTNSQWIQPSGCFSMVQSSGVGQAYGEFQTSSNGTQYRLVVYNANSTSGAITLYMDSFTWGPQQISMGPPVTDWVSYTPTITSGAGTIVATITGNYRRVGDSAQIQIQYTYTSGTGAAADFNLSLPSGVVADAAKLPSGGLYGSGYYYTTASGFKGTEVRYATTTSVKFTKDAISGFIQGTDADDAGAVINATFTVPVAGWSSNTVMSSDAATSVVAAKLTSTTTPTFTVGVPTKITWNTFGFDKGGTIADSTNSRMNIPVSGDYSVNFSYFFALANNTNNGSVQANAYVNGSGHTLLSATAISSGNTYRSIQGIATLKDLKAGDYVEIYITHDASVNLVGLGSLNGFFIERISGPTQIASSDTVAALYKGAPPTGSLGASANKVTFGTKIKDSHATYNSGVYTIPTSGVYDISAQIGIATTITAGGYCGILIAIDGADSYENFHVAEASATIELYPAINVKSVPLLAGQTVQINSYTNGTSLSFVNNGKRNWFSIIRVGNY